MKVDELTGECQQGKYLEIEFDSEGGPVGAVITNYLLEKVRFGSSRRDRDLTLARRGLRTA